MPLDCPRCTLTNSDSTPPCSYGYALTLQIRNATDVSDELI
jgi:hypothetical protein